MNAPARATACLVLLALVPRALPAQPASACASRDRVLARLAEGFGETRQSIGLGPNNQVVEVFASDATGTWTITVTGPDGTTCLIASGRAFESLHEALPPAGAPA